MKEQANFMLLSKKHRLELPVFKYGKFQPNKQPRRKRTGYFVAIL